MGNLKAQDATQATHIFIHQGKTVTRIPLDQIDSIRFGTYVLDPALQEFTLPSSSFGKDLDALTAEAKASGFTTTLDEAARTLILTKTDEQNGATRTITLQFDGDKNYRYATEKILNNETQEHVLAQLQEMGFVLNEEASADAGESVLVNAQNNTQVFFSHRGDKDISYAYAPVDEGLFSWSRTGVLKDETTGFWSPLISLGIPVDMILRFEARLGHTLNEQASNLPNGVYAFDTGNSSFPRIRYWMDLDTKNLLEESAIYVDPNKRPTPDQVTEYLSTLGFRITTLSDKETNDPLYYNQEMNMACVAAMNKPTDGSTFEPCLQFVAGQKGMENYFIKESISIIMPILEFGKHTMAEVKELYKAQPYFTGLSYSADLFGDLVTTNSEDFPMIVLWSDDSDTENPDNSKYQMALVIAKDAAVMNSPELEKYFVDLGWEKSDKTAITTYIDRKNNVMVQIDKTGEFGAYCLAFSPNEF